MRRISLIAVAALALVALLCSVVAAAPSPPGPRLRHHLMVSDPVVHAGVAERAREVVHNDGPGPVEVTFWFQVIRPCGGRLIGDPVVQEVPAGGDGHWDLEVATMAGCAGRYVIDAHVQDSSGAARDVRAFFAFLDPLPGRSGHQAAGPGPRSEAIADLTP